MISGDNLTLVGFGLAQNPGACRLLHRFEERLQKNTSTKFISIAVKMSSLRAERISNDVFH